MRDDLTELEKQALSEAGRQLRSAARMRKGPRKVSKRMSAYGKGAESFRRNVHSLMHVYRLLRPWLLAAPSMMVPPQHLIDGAAETHQTLGGNHPASRENVTGRFLKSDAPRA